jgi:hypothetical protein
MTLGNDGERRAPCAASPAEGPELQPGVADDPGASPDPLTAAVCAAATGPTVGGTSGTDAACLVGSDSGFAGAAPCSDDAARPPAPRHLAAEDRRFHGAAERLDAELRTKRFEVRKRNKTPGLKKFRHAYRGGSDRGRLDTPPLGSSGSAANGRLRPA